MRSLLITAAAALTLLAGCGGDDLGTESSGSSSGTGTARHRYGHRERHGHRHPHLFDG